MNFLHVLVPVLLLFWVVLLVPPRMRLALSKHFTATNPRNALKAAQRPRPSPVPRHTPAPPPEAPKSKVDAQALSPETNKSEGPLALQPDAVPKPPGLAFVCLCLSACVVSLCMLLAV